MATAREYFDTDFSHTTRLAVKLKGPEDAELDAILFYDFAEYSVFFACHVPGEDRKLHYFFDLIQYISFGRTQLNFAQRIWLPAARTFPGQLKVENKEGAEFNVEASFYGDPQWISIKEVRSSGRVIIYCDAHLSDDEISALARKGKEYGMALHIRAKSHVIQRSAKEKPLAFISHDSRDKKEVAKPIAVNLSRMMCPVWYDEFSLPVGANLRDTIEAGLKNCRKCVLVLSTNFFGNKGWTKKEFDSIFTREVLEEEGLVLPVWYRVSKEEVYAYSPSLLNVKGLDWETLGEDEVSRQLYNAIMDDESARVLAAMRGPPETM